MIDNYNHKKKNILKCIIVVFLMLCVIFVGMTKDQRISSSLITHSNSYESFNMQQGYFTQKWQADLKKCSDFSVPYIANDSFDGVFRLEFCSDDGSEILVTNEVANSFTAGESGIIHFSTPKINVVPGVRYEIRIQVVDFSDNGSILLCTKNNYSGAVIGGETKDFAINIEMNQYKNSALFWIFTSFGIPCVITLFLMLMFDRKFEECIGCSYMLIGLVLFIFGMFNCLEWGMYFLYFAGMVCIFADFYFINRKTIRYRDLLSVGMVIFVVISGCVIILCHDGVYSMFDELSHWGLAAKDMFYYDSFLNHDNTTVILNYPPMSTLMEYYFLYNNGLYSDEIVYIGIQTFLFSSTMILFFDTKVKKVKSYKMLIIVGKLITIIAIPVLIFDGAYNSIYVDPILGVLFGYVLISYFSRDMDDFNYIRLICGVVALSLVKDIGVIYSSIAVFIMMVDTWMDKKRNYKTVLSLSIVSLGSYFLYYIKSHNILMPMKVYAAEKICLDKAAIVSKVAQKSGKGPIFNLVQIINGNGLDYQYQCVNVFIHKFLVGDIFPFTFKQVSCLEIIIIVNVMLLIVAYRFVEKRKRIIGFAISSTIMAIAYLLLLLILYLTIFPEKDAYTCYSLERYFNSYIAGIIMTTMWFLFNFVELDRARGKVVTQMLCVGMVMLFLLSIPYERAFELKQDRMNKYRIGTDEVKEAFQSFTDRDEYVYIVCNRSIGVSWLLYKNILSPVSANFNMYDIINSYDWYENQEDKWGDPNILDVDTFEANLRGYSYLLILNPYDIFVEDYGTLFEEPETIHKGSYYKIIHYGDNKVQFKYIGEVEIGEIV